MATFTDGPASGTSLLLGRAPKFLRAVQDKAGKWDALDKLDDEPKKSETIFVYERISEPSRVHICAGKSSGWYEMANYRLCQDQPTDEVARDTAAWRAWCLEKSKPPVKEGEDDGQCESPARP